MGNSCTTCEHCACKLNILVPDHINLQEYADKVQDVFNSPVVALLKEDANSYTVKTVDGTEINGVFFNLVYECKFGLDPNSYMCQTNFAPAIRSAKIKNTVYSKKHPAEQFERRFNYSL